MENRAHLLIKKGFADLIRTLRDQEESLIGESDNISRSSIQEKYKDIIRADIWKKVNKIRTEIDYVERVGWMLVKKDCAHVSPPLPHVLEMTPEDIPAIESMVRNRINNTLEKNLQFLADLSSQIRDIDKVNTTVNMLYVEGEFSLGKDEIEVLRANATKRYKESKQLLIKLIGTVREALPDIHIILNTCVSLDDRELISAIDCQHCCVLCHKCFYCSPRYEQEEE